MKPKWIDSKRERHLGALETLKESFVQDEHGKPTFQGWGFREACKFLADDIDLGAKFSPMTIAGVIRAAVWQMAEKGQFSAEAMLQAVESVVQVKLMAPPKKYFLYSTLSIQRLKTGQRKTWMKDLLVGRARKFEIAKSTLAERIQFECGIEVSCFQLPVSVMICARDPNEAFDAGHFKLDLVRSIWNLYLNRQVSTRISSGKPSAVNTVLLGPVHTLHHASGVLATDTILYEQDYVMPTQNYDWTMEFDGMSSFFTKVERRLRVNPLKDLVSDALVDYVRALELRDYKQAFLLLWAVLERLLGSSDVVESKKKTISRAAFLFTQDRRYIQSLLERLVEKRNELVHGRKEFGNMEAALHDTRWVLERVIEFCLENRYGFKTRAELLEFLDLPNDLNLLAWRLKLMKRARVHLLPAVKPMDIELETQPHP